MFHVILAGLTGIALSENQTKGSDMTTGYFSTFVLY